MLAEIADISRFANGSSGPSTPALPRSPANPAAASGGADPEPPQESPAQERDVPLHLRLGARSLLAGVLRPQASREKEHSAAVICLARTVPHRGGSSSRVGGCLTLTRPSRISGAGPVVHHKSRGQHREQGQLRRGYLAARSPRSLPVMPRYVAEHRQEERGRAAPDGEAQSPGSHPNRREHHCDRARQ